MENHSSIKIKQVIKYKVRMIPQTIISHYHNS